MDPERYVRSIVNIKKSSAVRFAIIGHATPDHWHRIRIVATNNCAANAIENDSHVVRHPDRAWQIGGPGLQYAHAGREIELPSEAHDRSIVNISAAFYGRRDSGDAKTRHQNVMPTAGHIGRHREHGQYHNIDDCLAVQRRTNGMHADTDEHKHNSNRVFGGIDSIVNGHSGPESSVHMVRC